MARSCGRLRNQGKLNARSWTAVGRVLDGGCSDATAVHMADAPSRSLAGRCLLLWRSLAAGCRGRLVAALGLLMTLRQSLVLLLQQRDHPTCGVRPCVLGDESPPVLCCHVGAVVR